MGQFFQIVIQLDGPPDVAVGGGEITPLGRVTTQIELDQRILGVQGGSLGKNFGGGFQGIASALGKGPSHEPASFVRVGGGELGRQGSRIGPFLPPLEQAQFELHDPAVSRHRGGEVFQFLQSIIHHAEVGITHRAFGMLEVFPQLNQPAHAESYHRNAEN